MSDIVERLRKRGAWLLSDPPKPDLMLEAAAEIVRLRKMLTYAQDILIHANYNNAAAVIGAALATAEKGGGDD